MNLSWGWRPPKLGMGDPWGRARAFDPPPLNPRGLLLRKVPPPSGPPKPPSRPLPAAPTHRRCCPGSPSPAARSWPPPAGSRRASPRFPAGPARPGLGRPAAAAAAALPGRGGLRGGARRIRLGVRTLGQAGGPGWAPSFPPFFVWKFLFYFSSP